MRIHKRERKNIIIRFIFGLIICVFLMFPFIYMIFGSLNKASSDLMSGGFFPTAFQLSNYVEAIKQMHFFRLAKNTLIITAGSLFLMGTSSILVAYGFARFNAPGKSFIFYLILSTLMLPWVVTLPAMYMIFDKLHLVNTFVPLIAPSFGGSAFYIFMMRIFISKIPTELDDSAKMDGCTSFGILWRIIVPQMKPIIATMLVLSFGGVWSDYIGPSLYLQKSSLHTLSIGLKYFKSISGGSMPWHVVMAACTLFSVPMVVMMFASQKALTEGMMTGGIKG